MKTDIAPATKVSGKRVACLLRHWPAPPTSTAQAFFRQASLALLLLTTSSQQGRLRDVPPSTTPYKPCTHEIGPMEDSLLPATATSHRAPSLPRPGPQHLDHLGLVLEATRLVQCPRHVPSYLA